MNNLEMARSYINQATERIKHAKEALNGGNYPYVVRQCQEAVELLLKAALRIIGVEPPRWHDVGPVLRRERNKFPGWFQEYIDELASISRSLRKEREFSMYGDEESGIPPEELYTRIDAERALNDAEKVLSLASKLFNEVS
ncbi:HEPN domain-containing protein [Vulcanisaeta moutnovskia]|uniref:HEPN domain-containing protein n=1 Tax=Vulcanisaeta moutnovskia TaxID=985052 RepID=UPI0006945D5A|nr:HEPN domain-containing protein [Vulcanisaeta moutnovskia]